MSTTSPTPAQPLHTPIPWRSLLSAGDASIYGPDMNAVAKVLRGNKTGYEQKANIELIVRAVNAHAANEAKIAALVVALDFACRRLESSTPTNTGDEVVLKSSTVIVNRLAIAEGRAALALART